MKIFAILLAATTLSVAAIPAAEAGQRVVIGPNGGTRTVTATVDENGVSRSVEGAGAYGGTYSASQDCVPGLSHCERGFQATGAYGRTASGSATVDRYAGGSTTTGTVVGTNGGVYNRVVKRSW